MLEWTGEIKLFDAGTYNVLRSAVGSTAYKKLPYPTQWNSRDKPHVALLESTGDRVFSFLISEPLVDNGRLWVRDLACIQSDAVVEVKHSDFDYRYYRRDENYWSKVAEKKDQFFMDVFQRGDYPVTVPILDDNWSALD